MRKMFLLFMVILSVGLSNCRDSEVKPSSDFLPEEISFTSSKSNLSETSFSLGIQSLSEASLIGSNKLKFTVLAEPSFVNGLKLNLNNVDVYLTKFGVRHYQITSEIPDIGLMELSINIDSKSLRLTINGKMVDTSNLAPVEPLQNLATVLMTSLLTEVTQKENELNDKEIYNHGRIEKAYYGYTVGWGLTAEESVDHEKSVRDGATGTITQYKCTRLGTSTSCAVGSIVCTTISTFKCDDGVANAS